MAFSFFFVANVNVWVDVGGCAHLLCVGLRCSAGCAGLLLDWQINELPFMQFTHTHTHSSYEVERGLVVWLFI